MAERRMFAKTIIDSDAFLDMPQSTQLLYFQLAMRADDDGFINNPRAILRNIGCKDDDLKVLAAKKFIIPFESGVIVIKHWRIHNYIQRDRYHETKYKIEKAALIVDENGSYTKNPVHGMDTECIQPVHGMDTECIQPVHGMDTQVRVRLELGKDSKEAATATEPPAQRFKKPSLEEISAYCSERENHIDPQRFLDHYESNGWKVGKAAMKDWKAAIRTWEKNALDSSSKPSYTSRPLEPPEREIKGVELPQDFIDMMERHRQRLAMQEPENQNEPEQKEPENDDW